MTYTSELNSTSLSGRFNNVYLGYADTAANAKETLSQLADRYSERAKSFGYISLTGVATASGLTGLLLTLRDARGTIDPSKLPEAVQEAFALQFPDKFAAGELSNLSETSIEPLISGWVGKYTEILARDKLNAGEAIGGYRLADGDVARLATSPTQEGWDIIAEPSGQLFQVKATSDLGYIRSAAETIDDDGIAFITTNLDDGTDLSDLNLLLLEMDHSKDELVALLQDSVDEATDGANDFGFLEDILGPLALVVGAGTGAVLVKKAYDEYRIDGSLAKIRRRYGSRLAGKVAAMVSPIPFTGLILRKWIDTKLLLNDATIAARERYKRVVRLIQNLDVSSSR
jgi:hypothetical protein